MKQDEPKVSENRKKKEAIVAEVVGRAQKATAVVFTNYQGMTHRQMEELKKGLKNANAELAVSKNTLLKIALRDSGFAEAAKDQVFEQPTATLYMYGDPVAALKELAKSIKTLKLPLVKFGIFEGKVMSEAQIATLATLPPKEVLIAQFVGTLNLLTIEDRAWKIGFEDRL
jgi:large subunit ribosomal protein L10